MLSSEGQGWGGVHLNTETTRTYSDPQSLHCMHFWVRESTFWITIGLARSRNSMFKLPLKEEVLVRERLIGKHFKNDKQS